MEVEVKSDRLLDCLGLYCPEPVFRTRKELDTMDAGQVLEVVADDPAAEADITSLAKRMGQQIVKIQRGEGAVRIWIRKLL